MSFTPDRMRLLAESPHITPMAFRLFAILNNLQQHSPGAPVVYQRSRFARIYSTSGEVNKTRAISAFKELERLGLIRCVGRIGTACQYRVAPLESIVFNVDGGFSLSVCNGTETVPSGTKMVPSGTEMVPHNKDINNKLKESGMGAPYPTPQSNDFRYPQTTAEVIQAAEAQGVKMTEDDALIFLDNYASKGWMAGGARITNWRARIRLFMDTRQRIKNQGANNNGNEVIRGGHVVGHESDFANDPLVAKYPGS